MRGQTKRQELPFSFDKISDKSSARVSALSCKWQLGPPPRVGLNLRLHISGLVYSCRKSTNAPWVMLSTCPIPLP